MNATLPPFLAVLVAGTVLFAASSASAEGESLFSDASPVHGSGLLQTGADLDLLLASNTNDVTVVDYSDHSSAPRRWWPIVASAVIPGLGESLTGHRRGWAMIAADAGLWYGVKKKHDDGNDYEDEYKTFLLENWDQSEWEQALADGRMEVLDTEFGSGTVPDDVALWVTREEDEREWFENAGKWDVFAWGWREYWDDGWNTSQGYEFLIYQPGDEDPFYSDNIYMTPLRNEYIDLRVASNDAFETRDTLVNVAILLRVFSVLQTAYLEGFIGGRFDGAGPEGGPLSAGWFVAPGTRGATQVGWRVSY